LRYPHLTGRDEASPGGHREPAQHAPFFEGIDNEGAGLCALAGLSLLSLPKPNASLFFGFDSLALPLAAFVFVNHRDNLNACIVRRKARTPASLRFEPETLRFGR
jgi:hypothetical protein